MKRFHIHLAVENLQESIAFYTALFADEPSLQHEDYAKWMLDDPRNNFAISNRSKLTGIDHLGLQAENALEFSQIKARLDAGNQAVQTQLDASCCYAKSDKYWTIDPQGIAWETVHTLGNIPTFNASVGPNDGANPFACCPEGLSNSSCCG